MTPEEWLDQRMFAVAEGDGLAAGRVGDRVELATPSRSRQGRVGDKVGTSTDGAVMACRRPMRSGSRELVETKEMRAAFEVSEVRLRFPPDQSGPVVAYASCLINGCLVLNDLRIERGRREGLVIVYPSKASASGKRHSTFNPVTREAGEAIRDALFGRLARLISPAQGPSAVQEPPR